MTNHLRSLGHLVTCINVHTLVTTKPMASNTCKGCNTAGIPSHTKDIPEIICAAINPKERTAGFFQPDFHGRNVPIHANCVNTTSQDPDRCHFHHGGKASSQAVRIKPA